jgi:hypothetical protein
MLGLVRHFQRVRFRILLFEMLETIGLLLIPWWNENLLRYQFWALPGSDNPSQSEFALFVILGVVTNKSRNSTNYPTIHLLVHNYTP